MLLHVIYTVININDDIILLQDYREALGGLYITSILSSVQIKGKIHHFILLQLRSICIY